METDESVSKLRKGSQEASAPQGGLDFRFGQLRQRGNFAAIGADILLRSPVAVDIAVAHGGNGAKFHRNRHADILGNGEEAGTVLYAAEYLAAGSNHGITAAFGGGHAGLGKGGHSNRNTNGRRLIAHSKNGSSLLPNHKAWAILFRRA